ncbi:hypothetical protein I350_04081 [Cryptococcus amylolentus CBS 6273]|uniref:Uncharacterized protein n=1 Tax=Cryptococcus amylolentus CBS 6273 TaxID=1296118 RepID=A0A1E3K3C8_9TREE|nr:hypothetical protein I350_04081 [Cryptococcus amylolentus CBS 6273]
MSAANAIAGPSRPSYPYTAHSTPLLRRAESTFTLSSGAIASSRSSTPLIASHGPRIIRSGSVFSKEQWKKEEISRRRQESRDKLKSSWDVLFDKYKDVEDDDEVDLLTGRIVKDRGSLRSLLRPMHFGEDVDGDDEDSSVNGNHEFESDEDELGDWEGRSGLDSQLPEYESVVDSGPAWTTEDDEDFREFMRAEERRKTMYGDEEEEDPEDDAQSLAEGLNSAFSDTEKSPRSLGTRILATPTLADLFQSGSEDEFEADIRDTHDEASRKTPAPARVSSPKASPKPVQVRRRPRMTVQVVIPRRPRARSFISSSSNPPPAYPSIPKSASAPTLADLFTPPPMGSLSISKIDKGKQRMIGERPAEDVPDKSTSTTGFYWTTKIYMADGKPFTCKDCLRAGGDRKAKAGLCKGRTSDCKFASIDSGSVTDSASARQELSRPPAPRSAGGQRKRICRLCRDAGGERAEMAEQCLGKHSFRRCRYFDQYREDDTDGGESAGEAEKASRTPALHSREHRTSTKPHSPRPQSESIERGPPSVVPSRSATEPVVIVISDDDEDVPTPKPTAPLPRRARSIAKRPTPVNLAAPPSPPLSSPLMAQGRASRVPSLPPSSPPHPDVFSPVSSTQRPTMSPSKSTSHSRLLDSSPMTTSYTRPLFSISGGQVFQPTPPPSSTDGTRSQSLSSDVPTSSALKKSALRRPSESLLSGPGFSAKRTRFSLAPRSPPKYPGSSSTEPESDDESQDELDLLSSSDRSDEKFPVYESSSSPLRSEFSVRAADIGMRLGPEHTGRLPSTMIKSLVPSMSNYRSSSTLGSSSTGFALPTPPPSSAGSNGSRPSPAPRANLRSGSVARNGNSEKRNENPKAGLMLPPPIPSHRLKGATPSSSPLKTTLSSTPLRASTLTRPPASAPTAGAGIRFVSMSPAVPQARPRSRSQSVSIAPDRSQSRPATPTHPKTPRATRTSSIVPMRLAQTSPAKKSMIYKSLEKAVREVGDEDGLEWGLDEETDDGGRMWRDSSVSAYLH